MVRGKPRFPKFLLFGAAAVALLFVTRVWWLAALGGYLVHADAPEKADIAVVLAGDQFGRRILQGAQLVEQGYVPRVLMSGPPGFYGFSEAQLAIAFAVKHGYPERWFAGFEHKGLSTREEATALVPELRRRKVRRVLVVTSDYHTRRAGNAFRSAGPDLNVRVIAAPDEFFERGKWWRSRQGQKAVFLEWAKTIATWFGL